MPDIRELLDDIKTTSVKNIILDTDTYNEVDDQFALAYAMLSPERIRLLSVNAAPFLNSRSKSPADGMEKSYQEIFRIMKLVDPGAEIPCYRGSDSFLSSKTEPVESAAADNIINTVMNSKEFVYIVAIGAITNVASAIIKCPEITQKSAVIWLGGHALHYKDTKE
ncbi:MAG TPA: nucleoside hydrolase, partial [Bacillota bacterium]|nr:nucleoside hydrolase [Bacillota bacterium]